MIKITDEELLAFNILNNTVGATEQELQRQIVARAAYIKLLENKYDAVFDAASGQLRPKEEQKRKGK